MSNLKKPRLLFLMHYLEIGGAEISLIGMLQSLDYSRVDVDLFLYAHRGELLQFIPPQVNVLPEVPVYADIERSMSTALRNGHPALVAARLWARWKHSRYARRCRKAAGKAVTDDASIFQYVGNAVTPVLPSINPGTEYDLAISFLTPHNVCRDKVRARRKVAWIHTDYSTISVNAPLELPVWDSFDYIASISPRVTETFLSVFPTLRNKIVEIGNILTTSFVRGRAAEFDAHAELHPDNRMALLSVGRYTRPKNYDNVPDIARRMIEAGAPPFRWYIIGYGGEEALIRQRIAEAGMEDTVILAGKRANPYPYISACDVFVQPSRYEGKSVTVCEAQMLCKPVAITNYPTAPSQVTPGEDGIIVPLENPACAEALTAFLKNTDLQRRLSQNLAAQDRGNGGEALKLMDLIPPLKEAES